MFVIYEAPRGARWRVLEDAVVSLTADSPSKRETAKMKLLAAELRSLRVRVDREIDALLREEMCSKNPPDKRRVMGEMRCKLYAATDIHRSAPADFQYIEALLRDSAWLRREWDDVS